MALRILLAVDGSEGAMHAVRHVLRLQQAVGALQLHLLAVQIPVVSGHVRWFVSREQLEDYYQRQGQEALAPAQAALAAAGLAFDSHVAVGHVAETIVHYAGEIGAEQIVMGSHGRSGLGHLLLGSITSEVIRHSPVAVTVVSHG